MFTLKFGTLFVAVCADIVLYAPGSRREGPYKSDSTMNEKNLSFVEVLLKLVNNFEPFRCRSIKTKNNTESTVMLFVSFLVVIGFIGR